MVFGDVFPPNVSNIERDLATVKYGESVDISATITDLDGTVESAQIVYYVGSEKTNSCEYDNK